MDLVRAVIKLEVPEYQIGQPVTIYFKDTMQKFGICDKEQEAVEPTWSRGKPFCGACGLRIHGGKFCGECGKPIAWEGW